MPARIKSHTSNSIAARQPPAPRRGLIQRRGIPLRSSRRIRNGARFRRDRRLGDRGGRPRYAIGPRSPDGFALGWRADHIETSVCMPDGRLALEVHWTDRRRPVELVYASVVNRYCARLMIEFYQRLWVLGGKVDSRYDEPCCFDGGWLRPKFVLRLPDIAEEAEVEVEQVEAAVPEQVAPAIQMVAGELMACHGAAAAAETMSTDDDSNDAVSDPLYNVDAEVEAINQNVPEGSISWQREFHRMQIGIEPEMMTDADDSPEEPAEKRVKISRPRRRTRRSRQLD